MKSVREYFEYRDYLKDFFETKKKTNHYFSYRVMGGKVGMDASHLLKIFQKKRHIGTGYIETLAEYCGLKDRDAQYFHTLVHFNKAKSDRDIRMYYEKLLEFKGVKTYALEKSQYEFYTKWYYSAILTLLDFYKFSDDYKALAQKVTPPISEANARKSIALLEELGLIRKNQDNTYSLTKKLITTGDQCHSIAVLAFQEETIKLAAEALHHHASEKIDISTVTITLSQKNVSVINGMIKQFRAELLKYAEAETNPDLVYQLNVQLFPMSV